MAADPDRPGADALRNVAWIEVRAADPVAAAGFGLIVDAGEAEAMALAASCSNALLLIDDDRGRRLALRLGLRIKGTLGIILLAKQRGLLSSATTAIQELEHAGIHIAPGLVAAMLRAAGE